MAKALCRLPQAAVVLLALHVLCCQAVAADGQDKVVATMAATTAADMDLGLMDVEETQQAAEDGSLEVAAALFRRARKQGKCLYKKKVVDCNVDGSIDPNKPQKHKAGSIYTPVWLQKLASKLGGSLPSRDDEAAEDNQPPSDSTSPPTKPGNKAGRKQKYVRAQQDDTERDEAEYTPVPHHYKRPKHAAAAAEEKDDAEGHEAAVPSPPHRRAASRKEHRKDGTAPQAITDHKDAREDGHDDINSQDRHTYTPRPKHAKREPRKDAPARKSGKHQQHRQHLAEEEDDGGAAAMVNSHEPSTADAKGDKQRRQHLAEEEDDGGAAVKVNSHEPSTVDAKHDKQRRQHSVEEEDDDGAAAMANRHEPSTDDAKRDKQRRQHSVEEEDDDDDAELQHPKGLPAKSRDDGAEDIRQKPSTPRAKGVAADVNSPKRSAPEVHDEGATSSADVNRQKPTTEEDDGAAEGSDSHPTPHKQAAADAPTGLDAPAPKPSKQQKPSPLEKQQGNSKSKEDQAPSPSAAPAPANSKAKAKKHPLSLTNPPALQGGADSEDSMPEDEAEDAQQDSPKDSDTRKHTSGSPPGAPGITPKKAELSKVEDLHEDPDADKGPAHHAPKAAAGTRGTDSSSEDDAGSDDTAADQTATESKSAPPPKPLPSASPAQAKPSPVAQSNSAGDDDEVLEAEDNDNEEEEAEANLYAIDSADYWQTLSAKGGSVSQRQHITV